MNQTDVVTPRQSAPAEPQPATRPSFADEVRGRDPREIDLTLARVMRDVYDYDRNGRQDGVPPWRPMTDAELRQAGIDPALLRNEATGFKAALYTDDNGRHVLAFSGTDESKDWLSNFRQGLGFGDAQYNQAIQLARQAKVAFGQDVVITGHSLGGGLAAIAAVAADIPAVTFNAAGVHDRTVRRLGLDPDAVRQEAENGLIRRYAVRNDILTELQENTFGTRQLMPDAIGRKIELPDPDPLSFWQRLNPFKSIRHGIDMHYIDAVIDSMERTFGKPFGANGPMSNDRHEGHAPYRHLLDKTMAAEQQAGVAFGAGTQNLTGRFVVAAQRAEVAPESVDRIVFAGDRGYAMQGRNPEAQAVAFVVDSLDLARRTPLVESSREYLALRQSQTQAAEPPMPAQEPGMVARAR
jgi:Protein of unknown function (DUF2974)